MSAALSFGDDPDEYDRARPAYPAWIFDELLREIGPCRVVDVGCGTGAAATHLLARGCDVLGIEPDDRMAGVARRRGLRVEVAAFEKWTPCDRRFDLVCCAQAWHWIDRNAGLNLVAEILRPRGRFGACWYRHIHPPQVRAAIAAALGRPGGVSSLPDPLASAATALRDHPEFLDVEVQRRPLDVTYSTDEWLQVEASMGANRALPASVRAAKFATLEAVLRPLEPWSVVWEFGLVTATRRG